MMILASGYPSREQTLLPEDIVCGRDTHVLPLEWGAHLSQSSIVLDVSQQGRFLFD
jgi:hypothetical protein